MRNELEKELRAVYALPQFLTIKVSTLQIYFKNIAKEILKPENFFLLRVLLTPGQRGLGKYSALAVVS